MTKTLSLLFLPLALLFLAGAAHADTLTVQQLNLEFVPQNVVIQQGDTVHWVWTSGTHTVTSGAGLGDSDMGMLFDAPLDITHPDFSYTFDGPSGVYDYFCTIHFFLGMTGTVTVEEGGPTGTETSSWGAVKQLFSHQ